MTGQHAKVSSLLPGFCLFNYERECVYVQACNFLRQSQTAIVPYS